MLQKTLQWGKHSSPAVLVVEPYRTAQPISQAVLIRVITLIISMAATESQKEKPTR